jgi:hypothetical protein
MFCLQFQPQQVLRLTELLNLSTTLDMTSTLAGGAEQQDERMVSAMWRQLSYLSQHPDHCTVLLSTTPLHCYSNVLRLMMVRVNASKSLANYCGMIKIMVGFFSEIIGFYFYSILIFVLFIVRFEIERSPNIIVIYPI